MFRRLSEPLPLSEASLLALRPALNTPVLNVGFLPVGPARAALVVFAEEYGAIGIAFGIRSVEGRQVAVLRNQETIEETAALSEALEPALAAAERMGFLFDEDMLVESTAVARTAAARLWSELMGDPEVEFVASPPQRSARADDPGADPDDLDDFAELVLEEVAPVDLAELDQEIDEIALDLEAAQPPREPVVSDGRRLETGSRSTAVGSVESQVPERRTASLSKFRLVASEPGDSSEGGPVSSETPGPASPLGRIPLKRVRGGGRDAATRRIPYLARLLSSF